MTQGKSIIVAEKGRMQLIKGCEGDYNLVVLKSGNGVQSHYSPHQQGGFFNIVDPQFRALITIYGVSIDACEFVELYLKQLSFNPRSVRRKEVIEGIGKILTENNLTGKNVEQILSEEAKNKQGEQK